MTAEPAVPEPIEGVIVRAPEPDELSEDTRAAVEAGTAESTLRKYAAHWKDFTGWCEEYGRTPLPATSNTVTEHVKWLCYDRPLRTPNKDLLSEARDPRAKPRRATPVTPATLAVLTGKGLEGEQDLIKVRDTALMW